MANDVPVTFEIFQIFKELKKTESRFAFGKDNPEKKIKELRINFAKGYKNAGNDPEKLSECIKKARAEIDFFSADKKINKYYYKSPIWEERKKKLKELEIKFNTLDDQLKVELKELNNASENYGENEVIKGMEVFRTVVRHGLLAETINFECEIIVVLKGGVLGDKANATVQTKKNTKTHKVADIQIKPPDLSLLPVLGKSVNERLKKLDMNLCVYITFLNTLASIAGQAINIENQLPENLLEEITK